MQLRTLGTTGLRISAIGFGCGTGAGLMIDGSAGDQVAAVKHALAGGITYFDTAPIYGAGKSETSLGRALRALDANPIVSTKVALELDDLDDIAGNVLASISRSLERLQRSRVDVVQLHNRVGTARAKKADVGVGAQLTVEDILGAGGVVDGFREAQRRGWADFFGCCSYGGESAQLEKLVDSDAFDTMLVHYSMLNRTAFVAGANSGERDYQGIAARAAARGMGTSVLRVLEAGLLANNSRDRSRPGFERDLTRLRAFDAFRAKDGSLTGTAIRFALSNPGVTTVLVGISERSHIDAAVQAEAEGPLPPDTLARIGV